MTTAQHTPGPWTLGGCSGRMVKPVAPYGGDGFIADVDTLPNAHLISAAPELLAACQTLADYYKGHEATDDQAAKEAGGGVYRALVAARAAIAKAEGKDGGQ